MRKKRAILIIAIIVTFAVITPIAIIGLIFGVPPVLKNLVVEFDNYDPSTERAGAFIFNTTEDKVFLEFGAQVSDGHGGTKILPTFEYIVDPNSTVYSPINGFISEMVYQENTQDYEIRIKTTILSWWTITIDHVKNPKVTLFSPVLAGTILGNPGSWSGGLGRVELSVDYGQGNHLAPFLAFDPALRTTYENKVWQLMSDWETVKANSSIYDEAAMLYAGCLYATLSESQL
ncbi:MAG: hypothetical protein ACXQS8_03405 [Candidatus Helarchaeales archaeon]